MGYPISWFVEKPNPEFICPGCKDVLLDPVQLDCTHVACRNCTQEECSECPECKEISWGEGVPIPLLSTLIEKCRVKVDLGDWFKGEGVLSELRSRLMKACPVCSRSVVGKLYDHRCPAPEETKKEDTHPTLSVGERRNLIITPAFLWGNSQINCGATFDLCAEEGKLKLCLRKPGDYYIRAFFQVDGVVRGTRAGWYMRGGKPLTWKASELGCIRDRMSLEIDFTVGKVVAPWHWLTPVGETVSPPTAKAAVPSTKQKVTVLPAEKKSKKKKRKL